MSTVAPPAGLAIEMPSRSLGFFRPESSRQKIRLRRLGIDDRRELDRNLIVAARQHQRARVGEAERCIVRADLPDGVDRSLAAQDLHIETGVLVIALVERDEEIGVAAVVTEIGDQRDAVQRLRATCGIDQDK